MKLARMILIGSIITAFYHITNIGLADGILDKSYYSHADIVLDITFPVSEFNVGSENSIDSIYSSSDFLLSRNFQQGYTIGIKYLETGAQNIVQDQGSESNLWFGLQIKF